MSPPSCIDKHNRYLVVPHQFKHPSELTNAVSTGILLYSLRGTPWDRNGFTDLGTIATVPTVNVIHVSAYGDNPKPCFRVHPRLAVIAEECEAHGLGAPSDPLF